MGHLSGDTGWFGIFRSGLDAQLRKGVHPPCGAGGVRGPPQAAAGTRAGNTPHSPSCTNPSKSCLRSPERIPPRQDPRCRGGCVCCRGGGPLLKRGGRDEDALWQRTALLRSCGAGIGGCHSPAEPVAVPVTLGKVVSFYTDLGALPLSQSKSP